MGTTEILNRGSSYNFFIGGIQTCAPFKIFPYRLTANHFPPFTDQSMSFLVNIEPFMGNNLYLIQCILYKLALTLPPRTPLSPCNTHHESSTITAPEILQTSRLGALFGLLSANLNNDPGTFGSSSKTGKIVVTIRHPQLRSS